MNRENQRTSIERVLLQVESRHRPRGRPRKWVAPNRVSRRAVTSGKAWRQYAGIDPTTRQKILHSLGREIGTIG